MKAGFSVKIIDCNFINTLEDFRKEIKKYNFKMAGLSFLSSMQEGANQVARIVKEINPKAIVVAGGPHPTVFKERSIIDENVDIIVIGEGEITFVELIKAVKKNRNYEKLDRSLRKIEGIWFKNKNRN